MAQHFKETSTCPVCLNYLEDPVNLKCGFVCCLQCVSSLASYPGGHGIVCLTCSEVSQNRHIRRNRQLGRLVSVVREMEPHLRATLQMNPRIRMFQVDVTLDVDTANNYLYISEDQRQVCCVYVEQKRRVCPERFIASCCVLGSPRLTSGRHYWEVEVNTSAEWSLGVCKESVSRQDHVDLSLQRGFWTLSCRGKDTFVANTRPATQLTVSPRLHRVGVFLDLEMETLSFYHVADGSHIFTFPPISVAEPLRPFFAPGLPVNAGENFMTLCPGWSPRGASELGSELRALADVPSAPTPMDTSSCTGYPEP